MIAENIRAALRMPTEINREEVMLTAGVGYAELLPGANETAADLLDRAAAAVRRAKRLGPDQVVRYDGSVQNERNDRAARLAELGSAIDAGGLAIEYQPVMYLRTEELAGFEVHPRWRHPSGTEIDPAEYLAETEDAELGRRLVAHVLARVAADMQRWHNELPREVSPLFASINISHAALLTPGLVAEVRHILSRQPALKDTLRLEIAEVVLMENPERALQLMLDLSQTGVALSLDGFGIGYTSLTYVAQLPIDTIKVERAIVQAGLAGATGASMLRSVVSLSHELGRKVVADGLDVAEDMGLLRTIGCEYAQGQHCGPPQEQRETLQFLKGLRRTERQLKRRGLLAMRSRRREVLAADKPAAAADARTPVPAKAAEAAPPQVPARARPTIADRAKARPAPGRRPPPIPQQAPAAASGPPRSQPGMPGLQPAANMMPSPPRSLPPPAVAPLPLSAAQRFADVEPLPRMAPPPMAPADPAQSVAAASASLAALQAQMAKPASAVHTNGSGHHVPTSEPPPSAGHPAPRAPVPPSTPPNLGALPPEVAASLARLAGGPARRPPGSQE
jgi:EAL domain-containing protein (putative c-di-GMP-specific phosphodiesterase class I)